LILLALTFSYSVENIFPTKNFKAILVHGTFARNSTWYREGGAFFEALKIWAEKKAVGLELVSFKWSGALSASKRLEAAAQLVQTIASEFDNLTDIKKILIGHSHGANVIFLATQMLEILQKTPFSLAADLEILVDRCLLQDSCFPDSEQQARIRSLQNQDNDDTALLEDEFRGDYVDQVAELKQKLLTQLTHAMCSSRNDIEPFRLDEIYALGTPIDADTYWPAASTVKKVYSLYSDGDGVQTYSAQFRRKFADFENFKPSRNFIVDLKVTFGRDPKTIGIEQPKHLQLNNEVVGRWLFEIPAFFSCSATETVSPCSCKKAWLHFFKDLSRPHPKVV
jgi:hypothetical protein